MNNEKICSFYVSSSHLLTIILPYINEEIQAGKEVITILQNDFEQEVEQYLKNVKNLNIDYEKIRRIGWKKTRKSMIKKYVGKDILVIGNEQYIAEVNKKLNEESEYNEIINCYKITKIKRIDDILSSHDKILNTSGKNEKFSHNAQKRKTIKSQT